MRALVQRVSRAEVVSRSSVGDHWDVVGSIGSGLCAFVGATHHDTAAVADRLADKLWGLRVFDDDDGVMNLSVADVGGSLLVVSQFTLYGDTAKGRRPSWIDAARPEVAEPLVERVVERLRALGATVETGRFRTDMRVELVNDGPVTLMLDVDP
jgi:D-tyrosyl-tRNA(Tyr) deacylase